EETADGIMAICSDGARISAQKVRNACGGFSKADGLLPNVPDLRVYARTVVYFELTEAEAERLSTMPSVIYGPPGVPCIPYILPPVRYPDGTHYIKIGGDPKDVELADLDAIKAWFRTDGDAEAAAFLTEALLALIPSLSHAPRTTGSCVTSFTPHRKPLVQQQTDRIFALTGGCGAGAKCADEIGRLGAELVTEGHIRGGQYSTTFRPDIAGTYELELRVDDDDGLSATCTATVLAIATEGLRVEIFWDSNADMDTHLLNPEATRWFNGDDCYYANCDGGDVLNWGDPDRTDDDPSLDIDDTDGFGPENINIDEPAFGTYRVGVHAFARSGNVTVNVYCGGRAEPDETFGPRALSNNRFWRVADVTLGRACTIESIDTIDSRTDVERRR
ncbi:MAG: FAD-dependent oxidoreductase, partial [Myxococcota bacterium]